MENNSETDNEDLKMTEEDNENIACSPPLPEAPEPVPGR
jgi:hypothetical protein